jgi:cytochrome c551/c552
LASGSALANADLAKAKNCLACHAVDNKVVGPGYKEVAKKYAGDKKAAEAKLIQKSSKVAPVPGARSLCQRIRKSQKQKLKLWLSGFWL